LKDNRNAPHILVFYPLLPGPAENKITTAAKEHFSAGRRWDARKGEQEGVRTRLMPNYALDPQSPQARAIYDLAIHSPVFVPWLFNSFGQALDGLT
jgi:hypothetical protein